MARLPDVRYARTGKLRIAYQVFGDGPLDLVVVPGFISHLDMIWDMPAFAPMLERLGRFARCLIFDKRGTGLSDRDIGFGSVEERMDDIRAVMDAAGIERAALFGYSEGGPLGMAFAASHPARVSALALYGTYARTRRSEDYPHGLSDDAVAAFIDQIERTWGTGGALPWFIQDVPQTEAATNLLARYERAACSPTMAAHILRTNLEIDARPLLSSVTQPTIVLHSAGDPLIRIPIGRYTAAHIPQARLVEGDAGYHMTWRSGEAWFLDELESFLTGRRPASIDADRYLATVLFTDIVKSTEEAAERGDRAWRRLLDRHDELAAREVGRFGGRVVKTTGDGLLAIFDGPSRALASARAIRDSVSTLGLELRAGVHTGEVEGRGEDVGGLGVHIGARITALAGPQEIWVSRTVRDLTAGSDLSFVSRGSQSLKGISEPWEVYSLAE